MMIDDPESTGTPWRVGPTRPAPTPRHQPPCLRWWPTTRRLVIDDLEDNGPATVRTLMAATGRSQSAVRTALYRLEGERIVARGAFVQGRARKPSRLWRLR